LNNVITYKKKKKELIHVIYFDSLQDNLQYTFTYFQSYS
jgi:hypothetical protein